MESCEKSSSDIELTSNIKDSMKHRKRLRAPPKACDRFQVRDGAGVAIASAVLTYFSIVTSDKTQHIIYKNKVRRERAKLKGKLRKREE